MQPITVWATTESRAEFHSDQVFRLVAGLHRLEACKRLGWAEIPAFIMTQPELLRRLWEIDENLCHAKLNELEMGEHLVARKEIYEALHPETRPGGDRKTDKHDQVGQNVQLAPGAEIVGRFTSDTADQTGEAEKTIRRALRRAKKILPEVRDTIRGIQAVADSGVELDALARLDPETQRAVAAALLAGTFGTAREAVRAQRHAEIMARAAAAPEGQSASLEDLALQHPKAFGVIYADPPWRFETRSPAGQNRAPEAHYPTLDMEALCAMGPQVQALAAKDCVLFLWVVDPMLFEARRVIEAWGFTYKTVAFTWIKSRKKPPSKKKPKAKAGQGGDWHRGLGYWTRANPEMCLLATRGRPVRLERDVDQLLIAPRGAHSAKPPGARSRIERLVGGPYLELFARERPQGWTAWGAELGD